VIEQQENIERSSITLIFAGKFMEDTKQISEYNITEKDFVVLTVKPSKNNTKTNTPPRIQTPPQTTTQQTTQPRTTTPPLTTTQPTQTTNPPQTQTNTQTQTPPQTQPEPSEDVINVVTAMGFPRDEVIRALKMTGNNPTRAINLLTGGGSLDDDDVGLDLEQGPNTGFIPVSGGGQQGGQQGGGNVFASLRNHPLFVQMRALVQANPQYLEELLGNIATQSPQLFQIIQQNQDQFVQFLNEPVTQEQLQQALAAGLGLGGQQGGGGGIPTRGGIPQQGGGGGQPRQIQVQLTQEENEVVNNLCSMGFDRNKVLHYYILFEKDQEMTANYLLNHGFDEEGPTDDQ